MSFATAPSAVAGTARMTRSAASTASLFEAAARAWRSLAASAAWSAVFAANVTLWPALTSELPSALPTLPVPMIAMSMGSEILRVS